MTFPRRFAAGAAAVMVLMTAAPAAAAAPDPAPATGNGSWSVGPANRSGAPSARPHFAMEAPPGATVKDTVRVANLTDRPLVFQVYGADAYNTPRDAGFALRTAAEPRRDVGAWIRLPADRLTVPARTARDVPFTVAVPPNATPGEHIGGVVALNTAIESVQNAGNARVGLRRAVGARVYLRVAGPVSPGLRLETFAVDRNAPLVPFVRKGDGTLRVAVVNTGNLRLAPVAKIRATGLFGRVVKVWPDRRVPELLPGQRAEFALPWAGPPPLDAVTVRVELTAPGGVEVRAKERFVAVPWIALLGAVVAVFVLWSVLPRLIRRWRERAGLAAVVIVGAVLALVPGRPAPASASAAASVAAAEDPGVTSSPQEAPLGTLVRVRGSAWTPGATVQISLCGANAVHGSADCDTEHAVTAMVAPAGTFAAGLTAGAPPSPCPCVVRVTTLPGSPAAPAAVNARIAVPGHRTGPILKDITPVRADVVSAEVTGGGGWGELFGGRPRRTLVLQIRNAGAEPISGAPLVVGWGAGREADSPLDAPGTGTLPPGRTATYRVPVELPQASFGQFVVGGRYAGAVPFSTSFSTYPWGLLAVNAVALLLFVLGVRLSAGRWAARRRRGGARAAALPAGPAVDLAALDRFFGREPGG
ncbi:hypothetical protein [Spirillospora sp. NPDC047279]|uniref:hypothetical protein n=1 Tax=Spirillospora sp. NPDC047279 TaxID=3155478 RepID=UPI0033EF6333